MLQQNKVPPSFISNGKFNQDNVYNFQLNENDDDHMPMHSSQKQAAGNNNKLVFLANL